MKLHNLTSFFWPSLCGLLLGLCILAYQSQPTSTEQDFSLAVEQAAPAPALGGPLAEQGD